MDRTEVNASPVQKALQGIKKYKYVLLTALLGVLLLLLPQNEKAADSGSATPSAAENFDREALQNEMEDILSSLDGVGKLSLMLTVEGGGAYELAQDETASLKARGEEHRTEASPQRRGSPHPDPTHGTAPPCGTYIRHAVAASRSRYPQPCRPPPKADPPQRRNAAPSVRLRAPVAVSPRRRH